MNQILVTEKLYVTPELRKKKKFYKANFIVSILVVIGLVSTYVYAEYQKVKSENISQDILSEMVAENQQSEEEIEEYTWKVMIPAVEPTTQIEDENVPVEEEVTEYEYETYETETGEKYQTIGSINIPKINVNYPIISETTVELLKISPCKFYGPNANEIGNLCIAGHNYKNNQFFSKVPKLVVGDVIEITDTTGTTIKYSVYDKYTVVPEDTSCTSQNTDGKRIITLITCTNDNKKRVIVQAKEIG